MKPEFTEVLLSAGGKGKYPSSVMLQGKTDVKPNVRFRTLKHVCTLLNACYVLVVLIGLAIGVGLIIHYESKFAVYDQRISALETDLAYFIQNIEVQEHRLMAKVNAEVKLEQEQTKDYVTAIHHEDDEEMNETGSSSYEDEEYDDIGIPLLISDESEEGIDLEHENEDDEKEAEDIVFGRINAGSRTKREASPTNQASDNVSNPERSKDGLEIIEGSYGTGGKENKAAVPTESEGLRLYESLITTGGQGEPKAPEFAESEGSNVRSYHRNSAAWIESEEEDGHGTVARRRLEVKSGDMDQTAGITRFGITPTYARTRSPYSQHYSGAIASRRSSNLAQGNQESASVERNPNVIVRNSRVPVTGDNLQPRNTQYHSSYPYAPLKKIGRGDGEVIARVHQERKDLDEEDDPDEAAAAAVHGESSAFAVSRSYKGGFTRPSERDRRLAHRPHRKVNETRTAIRTRQFVRRRGQGQRGRRPVPTTPATGGISSPAEGRVLPHSVKNMKDGESSYLFYNRKYNPLMPVGESDQGIQSRRNGQIDPDAEELNIVQAEAWAEGPKIIAAHFVADASNFSVAHPHYEGNGRLRNADGIFSSWKASDWMAGSDISKDLALSPTGVVTIKKDGLYWLYAQIHYLDSHDINGFVLQINTEPFLTCTQMTETTPGITPKSNTCYTAGINFLKQNDRVLIRDIETHRFSIIKPEKSFFGLMRIGDITTKR